MGGFDSLFNTMIGGLYIPSIPFKSNLNTDMNARIERIAHDLEYNTYKDETHGRIARDNFIYGVAQAKIEVVDTIKQREDHYSEEHRIAVDAYAPTERSAYLAGKRDAMTELLKLMREE